MGIAYKPEQQAVIDCQNKNQLVSASAGSGKTTIMIQKIINMITTGGVGIKNILVLTYTKASAEEMKQKLVNAIYGEVKNNPALFAQIDNVETADISTIHSFFQKTLKKYFSSVGLNSGFEIIDEKTSYNLRNKAFENALENYQKIKNSTLIKIYNRSRNSKTLQGLVWALDNFLLIQPDKEKFCKINALKFFEKDNALKFLNKELCYFMASQAEIFTRYLDKLDASEIKIITAINGFLSYFNSFKTNFDFFDNYQKLSALPTAKFTQKDKESIFYAEYERLKELFTKGVKKFRDWNFYNKEETLQNLSTSKSVVKDLIQLTLMFQEEYVHIKIENNVLDYDDLEKYMLKLLENPAICEEIKSSYAEIYVDEYQDANRMQEKIISLIAKENNRFMVGDVKQSIYGFRQAEPDIFLENQALFEEDLNSEALSLSYNYRSAPQILDFVNDVFAVVMTKNLGKIDYRNTSMFVAGAEYKTPKNPPLKPVEINIITKNAAVKKEKAKGLYKISEHTTENAEFSDAMIEAFVIGKKIEEILGKEIYDAKQKSFRPITFGDITILLKKRSGYLEDFSMILSSLGIPIFANTNQNLYEDTDIMLLINLLSLVVNPKNDIALVSVLYSIFGGFDLEDLIQIKLRGSSEYFYENFSLYNNEDNILKKKILFQEKFNNFVFDVENLGVFIALNKIVKSHNFEGYVLQKPDGLEKQEKIRKFVSDFLFNGFNKNVYGFLKFAKENQDKVKAPSFNGGENCVSITTMHSSKGLEYPVVILANMGQDITLGPIKAEIEMNSDYGIALKNYNLQTHEKSTTPAFEAIKLANKSKDFAEQLRLLYVGLTRAKNHMIIVGTTKEPKFFSLKNDYQTSRQKTYLNLIINSLNEQILSKLNNGEGFENNDLKINLITPEVQNQNITQTPQISDEFSEENLKILENYFNFKYPFKTDVALKNTVTGLLKEESTFVNFTPTPQDLTVKEHKIKSSASIGTAYHKVMENLDLFQNYSLEDIKKIAEKIEIEDIEKVDLAKIFDCYLNIKKLNFESFLKEQKFVMQIKHSEVVEGGSDDKVLVQGMIDLVLMGEKNIIIDFKFSRSSNEQVLLKRYAKQLKLYKLATEKALNKTIDHMFIYEFNMAKFIKVF